MEVKYDEHGFPLFLADVPGSGASTIDANAKSGNPRHDTRSGKFGSGDQNTLGTNDPNAAIPDGVDPNAYLRQLDAVRDLAREMDDLQSGDIQDLLAGRLQRPLTEQELGDLMVQIRIHRINDLVDILDYQFRNLIENVKRGRRKVKVSAPRGWIRKTFNGLTDDEIMSVYNRLQARGHAPADLSRSVLSRIKSKERADQIGARLAELPESGEGLDLSFTEDIDWNESPFDEVQLAEVVELLKNQKEQPIIVNVNVENKPSRKIIKRDPKTGLVQTIEDIQE